MSEYAELLMFLKKQQAEEKLSRFLEAKGYADLQGDEFGLNQWTGRLQTRYSHKQEQNQPTRIEQPEHLVSFISIPDDWQEECLDPNSKEFRQWLSGYQWQKLPRINHPFSQPSIQACSEGIILTNWEDISRKIFLEAFLLIRRDGICEYGFCKNAYYTHEDGTYFQFIQIVGCLWQFLAFIKDLQKQNSMQKVPETHIVVNLRGTKDAYLGDLAEGWKEPSNHSFDSYRPRCIDKNLQIKRRISTGDLTGSIEDIVLWFATRIDNAWGQFEPRCYVHQDIDETQPFAVRRSK
jgi:hypothetical protein